MNFKHSVFKFKISVFRAFANIFNNALKEYYLKYSRLDLRCNNCQTWASARFALGFAPDVFTKKEFGYSVCCSLCSNVSFFNTDIAPAPILCDVEGVPINEKGADDGR